IMSTKQHTHLYHPSVSAFAIKNWKFSVQTTASTHLKPYTNLRSQILTQCFPNPQKQCDSVQILLKMQQKSNTQLTFHLCFPKFQKNQTLIPILLVQGDEIEEEERK
ncbi:unnamed protein product, partial [Vicia faba]